MKKELDEALCRDFPTVFRDRNGDMQSTAMCWGFECGPGWEPLIRKAAEVIEAYNKTVSPEEHIVASQIKEKYGTLRFYTNFSTNEIDKAIDEAENASATTCETCGQEGKLRTETGWLYTACDRCMFERRLQ